MAAFAVSTVFVPVAHALEAFKLYDTFSDRPLDPARWQDAERARFKKGGAMHLLQRTWGSDSSDFGLTSANWNTNFANPGTITQMRARVTVDALETSACPSNSIVADARARIIGGFFNITSPTPNSQLFDVIASFG